MHWHGSGRLSSALDEEEGQAPLYDPRVVLRLLRYLRPYVGLTAVSLVALLISTGATVATPWLVKVGIDALTLSRNPALLGWAALLLALTGALGAGATYLHQVSLARVGQRVLLTLRMEMFTHLQRLPLSFLDRNPVGKLMARVLNDVANLQEFLSVLLLGLGDLLALGGIVVAVVLLHPLLAAVALGSLPLLAGALALWQRRAWRSFHRVRRALARVNADFQEAIAGVRVVQAFTREEATRRRFEDLNRDHLEANLEAGRLTAALLPTVEGLTALSTALVVLLGGFLALRGELAVGSLVAFVLYIQRLFEPLRNLTFQYSQLQRAMTAGARIFELLDTPAQEDPPEAVDLPPLRGEVRFQGVRFAYTPGQEVLKGIDLHIRPGETVALVGPTGAGKTTLASLFLRLYHPQQGRVLVDGYDLREVKGTSFSRQTALVPQEPVLFHGTVRENIRWARPQASDGEVEESARAVGAHEAILSLPQGYDTPVGERGVALSMGQRHLISLARAHLADPRLLVLDEPTASLDPETEAVLLQGLRRLLQGRTALLISHRFTTIPLAHRVVVLEDGRVVEEGTPEDLLRQGGVYARLHQAFTPPWGRERTGALTGT